MPDWTEKYEALSDANKRIADEIMEQVVDTIGHEEGAIVIIADPTGAGTANFLYGGNALRIEPLLEAGTKVSKQYFELDRSVVQ